MRITVKKSFDENNTGRFRTRG